MAKKSPKKMTNSLAQMKAITLVEARIIQQEKIIETATETKKEAEAARKKFMRIRRDIITDETSPLFDPVTGEVLDHQPEESAAEADGEPKEDE